MPHAIWNGSITFGLVTIPVRLFTAIRENEGIHFHLLHAEDEGRIHNIRKCEIDGKEVAWDDVVRGFEYEKGKYIVVTDDELKKHRPEATQTIEIVEFVEESEIDPMLYDKPYWLAPEKKGRHAYALLRAALRQSGKVGIAKVVLRTREYLCAVKPHGDALVLGMMHFADEVVSPKELDLPPAKEKTPEGEMKAAMMLIDAMAAKLDVSKFHDTYREELQKLLEARAAGAPAPKAKKRSVPASNVIDLVEVLKRSLAASKNGKSSAAAKKASPKAHARKRAAS